MRYKIIPIGERNWNVVDEDEIVAGTIDRLETGYLATRKSDNNIIKRFRMIDALRDSFGEDSGYDIAPQ